MDALKTPLSTLFACCVLHLYTRIGAPTINVLPRAHLSFHLCPGAHGGSPLSSRPEPKSTLAIISLHLGQASLLASLSSEEHQLLPTQAFPDPPVR